MRTYRFGIIGCGKIAPRHAEQINRIGKLAAVCDTVAFKAEQMAEQFRVNAYPSLSEMLENEKKLDVISICTPNYLHARQSIECLKAGVHVLCEKPLAIAVKDADEMIAMARETGKKLFVVKSSRYNPTLLAVKQAIQEEKLGKIYSFQLSCFWNRPANYYLNSWRGSMKEDGGTLFTQFSHYIDVLYWMLGEVKSCWNLRRNFAHEGIIEFEDTGVVMLEMVNQSIGTINYSVNTFSKNMEVSLTLIGEYGTVRIGGEYLNKLEYQDIKDYLITEPGPGNLPNEYGYYRGSMGNHKEVYDNLIKAIENDNHPFTDAEVGRKTVEIIEKIYSISTS
jgi:UDP-N-acetyl-2-amino-2-deoxyglucuronate dehydrogenase